MLDKISCVTDMFPFCCGADVVGEFYPSTISTAADAKQVHKLALENRESGVILMTLTHMTPEVFETLQGLGWHDLITWKSNHGNYPITMLAHMDKKFEYIEPDVPVQGSAYGNNERNYDDDYDEKGDW